MKYGTKFRIPSKTNINAILKQFTYDLYLYIYKISIYYNKSTAYFNQWRCLVIKVFLNYLKQKSSNIESYNSTTLFKNIFFMIIL